MSIVDYVCDALCIEKMQLMHFAVTAPHRYKKYEIPKRSGNGTRTIAQPSKQHKFIQRIIISELEKNIDATSICICLHQRDKHKRQC